MRFLPIFFSVIFGASISFLPKSITSSHFFSTCFELLVDPPSYLQIFPSPHLHFFFFVSLYFNTPTNDSFLMFQSPSVSLYSVAIHRDLRDGCCFALPLNDPSPHLPLLCFSLSRVYFSDCVRSCLYSIRIFHTLPPSTPPA